MKLNLFSFPKTAGATKEVYIVFYKLVSCIYMYMCLNVPKELKNGWTDQESLAMIHGRKHLEAKKPFTRDLGQRN